VDEGFADVEKGDSDHRCAVQPYILPGSPRWAGVVTRSSRIQNAMIGLVDKPLNEFDRWTNQENGPQSFTAGDGDDALD
jgi:hypothetical protein